MAFLNSKNAKGRSVSKNALTAIVLILMHRSTYEAKLCVSYKKSLIQTEVPLSVASPIATF